MAGESWFGLDWGVDVCGGSSGGCGQWSLNVRIGVAELRLRRRDKGGLSWEPGSVVVVVVAMVSAELRRWSQSAAMYLAGAHWMI